MSFEKQRKLTKENRMEIELFSGKDLALQRDRFLEMAAESFPSKAIEARRASWNWMSLSPHSTEEFPVKLISVIHDSDMVGGSILWPIRVKIKSETIHAYLIGMTNVSPRARGYGLRMMKSYVKAHFLNIGNPNSEKHKAFYSRIVDTACSDIYEHFYLLRPFKILSKKSGVPYSLIKIFDKLFLNCFQFFYNSSHIYRFEEITNFGTEFDAFFENASIGYPIIKERKSDYLNWRFFHDDLKGYRCFVARNTDGKLLGYAVVRFSKTEKRTDAHLSDFLVAHGDVETFKVLNHYVAKFCSLNGADVLIGRSNSHCWTKEAFKKSGFTKTKRNGYTIASLRMEATNLTDITNDWVRANFGAFYMTKGDNDEDF